MLKVTLITADGKTICQCFDAEYHTLFRCRVPDTMQLRLYKSAPTETLESLLRSGQIDEDMDRSEIPSDLRDKLEPGELVTHMYVPTSFALQITPCQAKADSAVTFALYSRKREAWYDRRADRFVVGRTDDCEYETRAAAAQASNALDDADWDELDLVVFETGEQP